MPSVFERMRDMAFQPSTSIYIGTVPFDSSYRHVYYIPDRQQQESYFLSCCPNELRRNDYTYQRLQNAVVVPFNAEELYGYNYCMFKNANYGNRWFYSFIADIEYVSENSSRLYLKLDIFQTWFPDCEVPACNVEREHVNDDSIGAHIRDEGFSVGEMKVQYSVYDYLTLWLAVASAAEPLNDGTYVNVAGDNYQKLPSGTSVTVFDPVTQMGEFKRFMNELSNNGQQDAVSAVYMVPAEIVPGVSSKENGVGGAWIDASKPTRKETLEWSMGYTTLDGYTPKNNKLYCYPFEYVEISNMAGQVQQLRMELMPQPGATLFLTRTGGTDVNSRTVYYPRDYNGAEWFYEGVVTLPPYPTCNWVYQSWANIEGSHRMTGTVSLPVYESGRGYYAPSPLTSQGVGFTDVPYDFNTLTQGKPVESLVQSIGQIFSADIGTGIVNTAMSQYKVQAELSKLQRTPNTQRGGTNSSAVLVNTGTYGLVARKYTCRAEIAKQIDDFFSTYGYLVSETKKPNLTGRRSWNYVKTNACNVRGKVPPNVLSAFNSMFDGGITFWHTPDVGNYALDNSIV
jgi:hypothetical protein